MSPMNIQSKQQNIAPMKVEMQRTYEGKVIAGSRVFMEIGNENLEVQERFVMGGSRLGLFLQLFLCRLIVPAKRFPQKSHNFVRSPL